MEDRLKAYRMLQILSSRYDESYGTIFIPQLTNFNTANVILGIYGLVKFKRYNGVLRANELSIDGVHHGCPTVDVLSDECEGV